MSEVADKFQKLVDIIKALRDPETGCPWDIKQTHKSLKEYVVEEAYELLEAIDNNWDNLPDELGDLLLQVLLHAQIAEDDERFNISNVIDALSNKMTERHPHVFGDGSAKTPEEVAKKWREVKQKDNTSLLAGLSQTLPALLESHKIGNRVKDVFEFPTLADARAKMHEEVDELLDAIDRKEGETRVEEELGDLLFTVAQLGRMHGLNAEVALTNANKKFTKRFQWMEENASKPFAELNREEKEELWKEIKKLKH